MKIVDRPPASLGAPGKDLWNTIVKEYPVNGASRKVLLQAGQALDRLHEIGTELKTTGLTFKDKFGQPKLHPLVLAEGNARMQFCRCMRLLNLNLSEFLGEATDEDSE